MIYIWCKKCKPVTKTKHYVPKKRGQYKATMTLIVDKDCRCPFKNGLRLWKEERKWHILTEMGVDETTTERSNKVSNN